jgi:hypothetical protein
MKTNSDSVSCKKIVEQFKKEYTELLARFPDVTVYTEEDGGCMQAYAINSVDEAWIDLPADINNYVIDRMNKQK